MYHDLTRAHACHDDQRLSPMFKEKVIGKNADTQVAQDRKRPYNPLRPVVCMLESAEKEERPGGEAGEDGVAAGGAALVGDLKKAAAE